MEIKSVTACEVPEGMVDNDEGCDDQHTALSKSSETCDQLTTTVMVKQMKGY